MRLSRLATPALALAVALPAYAVAGPAAATSRADRPSVVRAVDGSRDVWFLDDGYAQPRRRLEPGRRIGDLTTIRVAHRLTRVGIQVRERSLPKPRRGDFNITPVFLLKTSTGRYLTLVLSVRGFAQGAALLATANGDLIECDGLRVRIRYGAGTAKVSIPRTCLGNPDWVRVQAATIYQFARSFERSYVDVGPARKLTSRRSTPRAFAPDGAITRPVALRSAPQQRALPSGLTRLLRSIDYLR